MAEVLVEAVSPFGFKIGGAWVNFDKSSNLKKEDYHAGDALELTKNDKGFITAVKVVTAAPPKKAFVPGQGRYQEDPSKSLKMARGAALKAVMGSGVVHDLVRSLAPDAALQKITAYAEYFANYIEKGL